MDNATEFSGKKILFQTTVIGKGKTEMGKKCKIFGKNSLKSYTTIQIYGGTG